MASLDYHASARNPEEMLKRALLSDEPGVLATALRAFQDALLHYKSAEEGERVFPGLQHVTTGEGGTFELCPPGLDCTTPRTSVEPMAELKTLVVELMGQEPDVAGRYRAALSQLDLGGLATLGSSV
jgi:hypothetical protein